MEQIAHCTHHVTDGTSFYRPLMNKVIQKAFTAEIRHIGLQGDHDKIKLKRISATKAIALKKAWTCIEDDQLKGTVFEWEAPVDTHTLWTSSKKGTLVTCVQTPPNTVHHGKDYMAKRTRRLHHSSNPIAYGV
jgi:hypothetical protein